MIRIQNVYYMLTYAYSHFYKENILEENLASEKIDNIYSLLAYMLIREFNNLSKRGLKKQYVPTNEEIAGLKGKLNIQDTIKYQSRLKGKLYCEFDDYTIDNLLNQIIKTSFDLLLRSNELSDSLKISIKKCNYKLPNVKIIDTKSINWNKIKYERNNKYYELTLNISKLIIEDLLVSKSNGKYKFAKNLSEKQYHKLFEKYILEYYKHSLKGKLEVSSPEIEWKCATKNKLPKMQSDIVLETKDKAKTLIIDAKFYEKGFLNSSHYSNKETLISSNLYQIFTYVKNMTTEKHKNVSGLLLYAKSDNDDIVYEPFIHEIDNCKIAVKNINLDCTYREIEEQLNEIANSFIENKL